MSVQANIPNLDAECDYLRGEGPNAEGVSVKETVQRITGEDGGEYGLKLRYWQQGEGEWHWFMIQEAEDEFACVNPDYEATDTADREEVEIAVEQAEDVVVVPRDRLPKWGDGSSYYTCSVCHGALREQDKVEQHQGPAHETCAESK